MSKIPPNKRKLDSSDNDEPPNKKNKTSYDDSFLDYYNDFDDPLDYNFPIFEPEIKEEDKEYVDINREINTLNDLIELGKMYESNKRYNIDLKILNRMVNSLTELNNMIGMETVKQEMVDHILFKIQNFDQNNNDMMHTVIRGPPGIGKTEVAKVIGKIYLSMGILKNDKFIKARRSDLIAGYLGQTAKATQAIIDSAIGGILFIDEIYSLGNPEKRDSFAKECIDTINENLTEKKTDFILIIAGYEEEINRCFFSYNEGLEGRFPIKFTIEKYKPNELFLIFKKKVYDLGWGIDSTITPNFFKENIEHFKFFGRDMETLFAKCKRAHSRRVFASTEINKKILNMTDLKKGFDMFKQHKNINNEDKDAFWKNMFL